MNEPAIESALDALIGDGTARLSALDLAHAQAFALALLARRAGRLLEQIDGAVDWHPDDAVYVRAVAK